MVSLTPAELRQRFETGADDAALSDAIDAEASVIEALYGPDATMTEVFEHRHMDATGHFMAKHLPFRLVTRRPIAAITAITERVGTTDTVLAADDYEVIQRYQIQRLSEGTNSRLRWGDQVTVQYVPEDDTALRKQVLVRLVQLNLAENGYYIEKTPEFTLQAVEDFGAARAQALRRLRKRPLLV